MESAEHLDRHPVCRAAGRCDVVSTRCCGKPVKLDRPRWPCEIPPDAGLVPDCCDHPFLVYREDRIDAVARQEVT